MKNKYMTKQQKQDIAISILYDWSLGDKGFPQVNDILTRLNNGFMRSFRCFNTYKLLVLIETMMTIIEEKYAVTHYRHINSTLVELYAKEHGFHISPMKVITL